MKGKMKLVMIAVVAIFAISASLIVFSSNDDGGTDGADPKVRILIDDKTELVGETYTKNMGTAGGVLLNSPQSYSVHGAPWLSLKLTTTPKNTFEVSGIIPHEGTYDVVIKGPGWGIDAEWRWSITAYDRPASFITVMDGDKIRMSEKRPMGSEVTLPSLLTTSSKEYKGYYTSPYGGDKVADSNGKYILSNAEETLYSQWYTIPVNNTWTSISNLYTVKLNLLGSVLPDRPELYSLIGPSWLKLDFSKGTINVIGPIPPSGIHDVLVIGVINSELEEAKWIWHLNVKDDAKLLATTYVLDVMDGGKKIFSTQTQSTTSTGYTKLPTMTNNHSDTFMGYYTAESGGTRVAGSGEQYKITKTETLYAQWSVVPIKITPAITIKFDSNGGINQIADMYVFEGEKIKLPNLNRQDYDFRGWTEGSTSGKLYEVGDTYTVYQSTTFYAKWVQTSPSSVMHLPGGDALCYVYTEKVLLYETSYVFIQIPQSALDTFNIQFYHQIPKTLVQSVIYNISSLFTPYFLADIGGIIYTEAMWLYYNSISEGRGVVAVFMVMPFGSPVSMGATPM